MKAGGTFTLVLVHHPLKAKADCDCGHSAGLLPDETVLGLIGPGLLKLKDDNFILDGFPRKESQAQLLDGLLGDKGLNLVVELAVPDSVILSRIEGEHSRPTPHSQMRPACMLTPFRPRALQHDGFTPPQTDHTIPTSQLLVLKSLARTTSPASLSPADQTIPPCVRPSPALTSSPPWHSGTRSVLPTLTHQVNHDRKSSKSGWTRSTRRTTRFWSTTAGPRWRSGRRERRSRCWSHWRVRRAMRSGRNWWRSWRGAFRI